MKKANLKVVLLASLFAIGSSSCALAEELDAVAKIEAKNLAAITQSGEPPLPNSEQSLKTEASPILSPKLDTPVLKTDDEASKKEKSKKLNLSAVIFDPHADFKAQAIEEGRDATKFEELEGKMHEALHGQVTVTSKLSKKPLLSDYLTIKPKSGPLESLTLWGAYQGTFQNVWNQSDYQNTLYDVSGISSIFEGKFKDKKTSFRSMYLLTPGKTPGRDFFNEVWGDQYLMYSWSKNDQILAGYARNTLGIEGSSSPYVLPFINRSQIAKAYNNVRSLQVKAQGDHKLYKYSLAFGSAGRYFLDWFPGPEFTGEVGFKPLGLTNGKYGTLLIGGGMNAGNAQSHYVVGNAFMDYEYKRLNASIEYGAADGANGSSGFSKNQSEGLAGTIAYRLTPKIQILGRYDQYDPNKSKANDIKREYTAGLNYFIKGQTIKLSLNYVLYSQESGTYGSKLLVGTQLLF